MTMQTPTRTRPDRAPSGFLWGGPECGALVAVAVEFENQYRNRFGYFEPAYGNPAKFTVVPGAPVLLSIRRRMTDADYVRFVWTSLLPKLDEST